jgi:hypothetical protein
VVNHAIRFDDGGPEDVLVETWGTASMEGLDAVVDGLLSDRRYLPGMAVLFDHSRLDWSALRPEDLVRRLHVALKRADLLGPSCIAVVAADPRISDARLVRQDEPPWKAFAAVEDGRAWLAGAAAFR